MTRKKRTATTKPQGHDTPQSPTGKERPPPPSIFIPPTPSPSNESSPVDSVNSCSPGRWAIPTISGPPRKMRSPVSGVLKTEGDNISLHASSIASPEILALASFQASMKQALSSLSNTMEGLESQSARMEQLGTDVKLHEQVKLLRSDLEDQIRRQKADLDAIQEKLQQKVKAALEEHIKTRLRATAKQLISDMVRERVNNELNQQMNIEVCEGSIHHERQITEVKTCIHNSEARRYNASLQSASLDVPLRPLLRPLPSPEQSPYPSLSVASTPPSRLPSAHPRSADPLTPSSLRHSASTISAGSTLSRSASYQATAPTPSALFPKDLKTLFELRPDDAKTLLKEYGLEGRAPSPVVEEAKLRAPGKLQRQVSSNRPPKSAVTFHPSIPEESDSGSDTDEDDERADIKAHVEDMNTFMAHIGVPFLMVPPPKHKESNAERRKKLAPLIIGAPPWSIR